ncbi:UDP-N-acetylglucosamine 2-epimerase, partial [Rhodomicrobium udaipurense JA643]
MRILLAFGTRPEIIKLAPVYRALRSRQIDVDVLWTGQHTDLAAGLIDFFGIDIAFNHSGIVAEAGLAAKVGIMTKRIESVIRASHYDWIVVQGDTGTALAAATAGFLNAVPVAHVEAGLRTGDMQSPWPEEFNRRVISLCTTLHFAPTPGARANLLAEDIRAEAVRMVGNTVVDALQFARARVANGYTPINPALASLPDNRKIVLATLHRRENIGDHMDEV